MDARGLHVFTVHSGVADVRVRERDDLLAIARIGEDFLVTGERGVEHHFARSLAGSTDGNACKDRAVGEREKGFRMDGKHGFLQMILWVHPRPPWGTTREDPQLFTASRATKTW
ncbi:hypothetical protein D9M68_824790 [compost metagenome]